MLATFKFRLTLVLNDFPIGLLHRRMIGLAQSATLDQQMWTMTGSAAMTGSADGARPQAPEQVDGIGDEGPTAER